MRWVRRGLLAVIGLLLLAYGGAIAYLAVKEPSMVYLGASRTGQWRQAVPDDSIGIPWDTIRVEANGERLLLLKSEIAVESPWAIYFHGAGASVGSPWIATSIAALREAGLSVLAVEYPGYGGSGEREPSEATLYADAAAAWQYLSGNTSVSSEHIVIVGESLGAGVATYLATQVDAAGLVTLSAWTALPELGQQFYPWLPVRLIMRNRFDNLARAPRVAIPWLIVHGTEDELVPVEHARRLAAAAPNALVVLRNHGHEDSWTTDRTQTIAAIQGFANEVVR